LEPILLKRSDIDDGYCNWYTKLNSKTRRILVGFNAWLVSNLG